MVFDNSILTTSAQPLYWDTDAWQAWFILPRPPDIYLDPGAFFNKIAASFQLGKSVSSIHRFRFQDSLQTWSRLLCRLAYTRWFEVGYHHITKGVVSEICGPTTCQSPTSYLRIWDHALQIITQNTKGQEEKLHRALRFKDLGVLNLNCPSIKCLPFFCFCRRSCMPAISHMASLEVSSTQILSEKNSKHVQIIIAESPSILPVREFYCLPIPKHLRYDPNKPFKFSYVFAVIYAFLNMISEDFYFLLRLIWRPMQLSWTRTTVNRF